MTDDDERIDALERRVSELEATTRALRGYVGDRRAVAASVERRADAALAAVDRIETDSNCGANIDRIETNGDCGANLDRIETNGDCEANLDRIETNGDCGEP